MTTLLESVGQQITPEVIGSIGKAIGVDTSMVQQGLDIAGPLVQGGLAKKSETTAGLDAIMKMLPQDGASGGGLGDIIGMLTKGGVGSELAQTGLLTDVFGQGTSAIGKTLSAKLGFDVTPILAMAVPAIMGAISNAAKTQKLDSAGIGKLLQTDQANFVANAKPEVLATLNEAWDSGSKAVAVKATFTDDEWLKVRLAPVAATFYVITASPSGAIGSMKELSAAGDTMKAALKDASATSLVNVAFGNAAADVEGDVKINENSPRDSMLNGIKSAYAAVKAKMPGEAESFAATLNTLAQNVASAAKEGGFLGIGGKQISAQEQQALDEIKAALA
jgi:hypothetical protein